MRRLKIDLLLIAGGVAIILIFVNSGEGTQIYDYFLLIFAGFSWAGWIYSKVKQFKASQTKLIETPSSGEAGILHKHSHLSHEQFHLSQKHFHPSRTLSFPPLIIPPRPLHLHGRESELQIILTSLQPGSIFILSGPNGVGKTALVSEALHQITKGGILPPENFPDGVLFYSFCNQPTPTLAFETIVRAFGEDPTPTLIQAAHRVLSGRRTLLVLDEAEAAENLQTLLDNRGLSGVLVICHRRKRIFENNKRIVAEGLDLTPLELEPSLAVLRDWTDDYDADEESAKEICKLTGGHPLALRLAGCFMSSIKKGPSFLAALLKETPLIVLDDIGRSQDSIPLLLNLILEQVTETARDAFVVAGCLTLSPFTSDPITAALKRDKNQISRALKELVQYGLLNHDGEAYEFVNPLISEYARNCVTPPLDILGHLVIYYDRIIRLRLRTCLTCLENVLPHIEALFIALEEAQAWDSILLLACSVDDCLTHWGRCEERIMFCRWAVEAASNLGSENELVAWLNTSGLVNRTLGKTKSAIEYHAKALDIARKNGDLYIEGNCLCYIGQVYRDQGQLNWAIEYYQRALTIAQEIGNQLGESDELHLLGEVYIELGEQNKGRSHLERSLSIKEEIHPAGHPSIILTRDLLESLVSSS